MSELIHAVNELTDPSRLRREYVTVQDGQPTQVTENLTGYSLLEELIDAIEPRANNGERGGNSSHLPIDAGALDLWVEVSYDTHWWAKELEIDRTAYPGKEGVPLLLRSVATTAQGRWEETQLDAATTTCRLWATKIRSMLHSQRTWRAVRGVACQACDTDWITEKRYEDGQLQTYREPALIIHTSPVSGSILYFLCRACGGMTWPTEEGGR